MNRREFLKELVILPVLALPRPKGNAIMPEAQQDDKALLTGIERASTKLIDNANFDVEVDEATCFLDALKDTITTIKTQAQALTGEPVDDPEAWIDLNLYGRFYGWGPDDFEPGATVYLSRDKGNSWERMGNLERLLDSCECASSGWRVECKQCETVELEYGKCLACGSPDWTLSVEGLRCANCGAEDVDPRIEKGAKCTVCDDGVLITDFDHYDLGNCDSLCALEHLGATVNRKAQDEQV